MKLVIGFVLGAALLFAASLHPSAAWRLDVLRLAASGRLRAVSPQDLVRGLSSSSGEHSAAQWLTGTTIIEHANGEPPCPVPFNTPVGTFQGGLVDEFDVEWFVGKHLGLHKPSTVAGLMPAIEPGDVVIEVGAWYGAFAKTAVLYGAEKVIAIEPVPDTLECLRRNLAGEIDAGKVVVVEAAVWSEAGSVRMKREGPNNFTGGSEGWNVSAEGPLEVRAVTIDGLVAELGLERVDVIEMDIEGAERQALAGARETIQRFGPEIAACIHHLPDDPVAVPAAVQEIRADYRSRSNGRHIRYFH